MNTKTNNNTIILLSGGLDSLVSTALVNEKYKIIMALYFDYGQTAKDKELWACKKICEHYNIDLQIVNTTWLTQISKSAPVNTDNNVTSYWIPNRNGLFVNIGACFAESLNCKYLVIGANKEEAKHFKDNSAEFIDNATRLFSTSTQNNVEVIAPLIQLNKQEIIQKAVEKEVPLELVWSCYKDGDKHCGECPSCKLLKSALAKNGKHDLQKMLF